MLKLNIHAPPYPQNGFPSCHFFPFESELPHKEPPERCIDMCSSLVLITVLADPDLEV